MPSWCRFKGTPERVVVVKHAFRNAMLPVLMLVGLQGGGDRADLPLARHRTPVAGAMVVAMNLLVDILYAYVDPRMGSD